MTTTTEGLTGRALLDQTLAHVAAHPEQWAQDFTCALGTACLIGHVISCHHGLLIPQDSARVWKEINDRETEPATYAAELLGVEAQALADWVWGESDPDHALEALKALVAA